MAMFIFDKDIFQKKFIQADGFKNRAKSTVSKCDSICPNNTDNANVYRGYTSKELLADTLHNVFGEVLSTKKTTNIEDDLKKKMIERLEYNNDAVLERVFLELIESIFFNAPNDSHSSSAALLRYLPASKQKDFGKFVYDVFLDDETKVKLGRVIKEEVNPLDDMVNCAYSQLNVLQSLSLEQEYSRLFVSELEELFNIMNKDFRAALDNIAGAMSELEFLFAYYLFIYLSQFALRIDVDINAKPGKNNTVEYPLFKGAKEGVSEDRECISNGWRRIEKKTKKIFKHMIVLNMLNCHTNDSPYLIYSELYEIYDNCPEERKAMDDAVNYIIDQYTVQFTHDTDISGIAVDFSQIEFPNDEDVKIQFRKKIKYLFQCVSFQLDSKNYRQNVVSYVAGNYNHILKMRFVKTWGQLGQMMMITNEDLITMISICQRSSDRMIPGRGIQISDLFEELKKRGLCMDGKTKQFVIDYLVQINLIDSKCDSEEAQYVKRIQ
ncbi:MAG: DNA phosphorothioation-dependent restriction protein DptG [Lachnospiraceae bacterium]|nr:DNA phosphorothioation-dependent restriction protein DptG [Lachnospiraceae bacterium]